MADKDYDEYQKISENSDEHYDYCTEDINPPPLPPRTYSEDTNCQTFPRRRKNLFNHLGLDNTLPPREKNIVVRNMSAVQPYYQEKKKDLVKYLGMDIMDHMQLTGVFHVPTNYSKKRS